jgi:SAM-dependent methyltransferase
VLLNQFYSCGHGSNNILAPFDYRRCLQCGLVFNSPRLTNLFALYDKDYFLYHIDGSTMRRHVLNQIERLILPATRFAPGKRVIELGSGRGHLSDALHRYGFDVQGLEISTAAVAESRSAFHVPVFAGTAEEYLNAGNPGAFNIALACTVIEHVGSPASFVDACASLLRPGGILIMDTPNIDFFNAQAAGRAWDMYQKYHVYLFSPTTITLLLQRHHFEVIRTFSYDNYPLSKRRIGELKRMRRILLFLDNVGLYPSVRSWYRKRQRRRRNTPEPFQPITREEIERLGPFENSADAKGPLAGEQRGDHLVVIARKISAQI